MRVENAVALAAALVLLSGSGISARNSRRNGDGLVTALSVFLAVWGLVLLLFGIPWVRYTATSWEAWIAVYGSAITFVGGCLLATRVASPRRTEEPTALDPARLRLLWAACTIVGFIGFADFVHAIDVTIGWRALFDHPELVRITESTSAKFKATYGILKLLTYFEIPAFLLWTLGLRIGSFRARWRAVAFLGWLCLSPFLFTADRTFILTALIWAGCFHLMWRPVTNASRFVPAAVACGVVLVLIFTLLGGRISKTIGAHPEVRAQLRTQTLASLALPYVYLTSGPPSLSKLMADPARPHTDGRMTVLPVVKLLHAAGIGGTPPEEVGAFYAIPFETFNTYSWLGTFFLDFGLAGCLALTALAGFGFNLVVLSAIRRRHLVNVWFASLALYVLVFSPIVNKLSTTFTWEYGILGPIVFIWLPSDEYDEDGRLGALRERARKAPRPAIAVIAALLAATAVLLVVHRSEGSRQKLDARTLSHELAQSMKRAIQTRHAGTFPSSDALASRLHVDEPSIAFIPVAPPAVAPQERGVVGVYSAGTSVILAVRGSEGITQLSSPAPPLSPRSLGPGGNLVGNPGFDEGLTRRWSLASNGVARVSVTGSTSFRGHHSLLLTGTGTAAAGSLVVEQVFGALPAARPGAVYDFGFVARRVNLSRTVIAWIKVSYVDGTYQAVVAAPRGAAPGSGIPPGTDASWHAYVASARAMKSISSIELFICDTGSRPLSGDVQITDVSLTLRRRGQAAYRNVPALPPV